MFETVTWVKPDKSFTKIMVEVKESGGDIEFDTSYLVQMDDIIRRGHKAYAVYEVLGTVAPFTVRCEPNKEGRNA
jgi:hypothetical protein